MGQDTTSHFPSSPWAKGAARRPQPGAREKQDRLDQPVLDQEPAPTVYWCVTPLDPGRLYLVRAAGNPGALAASVREAMRSVEPSRAAFDMTPLTDRLSEAYADATFRALLGECRSGRGSRC
jgi:hypothetical protein